MHCAHCETRIENGEPFSFRNHNFCCECMLTLCSWFLEGGFVEDPDMFAHLTTTTAPAQSTRGT